MIAFISSAFITVQQSVRLPVYPPGRALPGKLQESFAGQPTLVANSKYTQQSSNQPSVQRRCQELLVASLLLVAMPFVTSSILDANYSAMLGS